VALDTAKEASSKERSLIRMQEQAGLSETHNLDLTFAVRRIFIRYFLKQHELVQTWCCNKYIAAVV
jgi:hypothetical protein